MNYVNTPQVRAIAAGTITILCAAWLPRLSDASGLTPDEVAGTLAAVALFAAGGLADLARSQRGKA